MFFLLGVLMTLRVIIQLFTKRLFVRSRNMKLVSGVTWWVCIIFLSCLSVWFQIMMIQGNQELEAINFWLLLQLFMSQSILLGRAVFFIY